MGLVRHRLAALRDETTTRSEQRLLRVVSGLVVVAALATVPVTIAELNGDTAPLIVLTDWAIWCVFAFEWALMFAFPPAAGGFVGQSAWDRRNWGDWRNWLSVGILAVTFPLVYPAFQFLRLIRVARLARIGRAAAVTTRTLGQTIGRRGVVYVAALVALAIFLGGSLMISLEPTVVGGHDLWSGLWWAATTTIGTGIGGPSPQTIEGRAIAIVLMLCGVAFVTTLAGSIAAYFLGQTHRGMDDDLHRKVADIHAVLLSAESEGLSSDEVVLAETPNQRESSTDLE